jgi:ADP-ribosyl-[dinitrogen reductase] hydrolase
MRRREAIAGCLLGQALGDAVGLRREGLSRRRAFRLYGGAPLTPLLIAGRGFGSDDTEHACLVGQALLVAPGDPQRFARSLAWGLRWWLAELPAGIGLATLRSIIKLWLGFPPERSGVRSAGNGPLMRAPLLGACVGAEGGLLDALVDGSTGLTHRDPRPQQAARMIARGAALAALHGPKLDPGAALAELRPFALEETLRASLDRVADALQRGAEVEALAGELGLSDGVSGFVTHTFPIALYGWLRHPTDFRRAIESVVLLGGDTDTVAAITGGLVGATVGRAGLPAEWLARLGDWPRSVAWMDALAERLARQFPPGGEAVAPLGQLPLFGPLLILRNLAFMAVVLAIGFRRLLPPY